jgi:hypothetical protein
MPRPSRLPVGIIVETRTTGNPWQPFSWRTVEVLPGISGAVGWRRVAAGPGWSRHYAGSLAIELFPRETAGYRETLSSRRPVVFVVLRKTGDTFDSDPVLAVAPLLATVCPYEAQAYLESGNEIVDGVPMPAEIADWVGAFIASHPPDQPLMKRQRSAKRRDVEACFRPFRRGEGE